ncbi:MAG: GNAT family N-acetyltransferase [Spirochaetales bacterium]
MIAEVHFSRELIDQIIFGMENQDQEFYLDTHESTVVPASERAAQAAESRYIPVPPWQSVDGYNLMEQFVSTLHNPIFRERLRAILASGRGVFRQFKDTVRERREIERSWFTFKDRHMRALVTEWFNEMREREGLERLAELDMSEATDELVDVDFVFREMLETEVERIESLDREAFSEIYDELSESLVELHYREQRAHKPGPHHAESRVLVAETLGEEFAGFLWVRVMREGEARAAFVQQLYVLPEFRGLGVARALLERFFDLAHVEHVAHVVLSLNGAAFGFVGKFESYGMSRVGAKLTVDVEAWHRAQHAG